MKMKQEMGRMKTLHRRQWLCGMMFTLFCLLWPLATQAASFDCAKASTKVEKMICGDAELSKLDEELGKAYGEALQKASDPAALRQQQRKWLKKRNGCTNADCVGIAYHERLSALTSFRTNTYRQVDDSCEPINKEVDGGKHCGVCQAYLKLLNSRSEPVTCEIPSGGDFKEPHWETLDPWADPRLLYEIDTYVRQNQSVILPGSNKRLFYKDIGFDDWLMAYRAETQDKRPGYQVEPVLLRTRLDLNGDGKKETVLVYRAKPNFCAWSVGHGYEGRGGAYNLLIWDAATRSFDPKAAYNMAAYMEYTPLIYHGRFYLGWSYYDASNIPNRESDVRLIIVKYSTMDAINYCHYKMALPAAKSNQGEE